MSDDIVLCPGGYVPREPCVCGAVSGDDCKKPMSAAVMIDQRLSIGSLQAIEDGVRPNGKTGEG